MTAICFGYDAEHTKIESTVRYLGIEVEDALDMAEQTDIQRKILRELPSKILLPDSGLSRPAATGRLPVLRCVEQAVPEFD